MSEYLTIEQRKANIRKMSTKELKTYPSAFKKGQIYAFANEEALKELKRRKEGKTRRQVRPVKKDAFQSIVWG